MGADNIRWWFEENAVITERYGANGLPPETVYTFAEGSADNPGDFLRGLLDMIEQDGLSIQMLPEEKAPSDAPGVYAVFVGDGRKWGGFTSIMGEPGYVTYLLDYPETIPGANGVLTASQAMSDAELGLRIARARGVLQKPGERRVGGIVPPIAAQGTVQSNPPWVAIGSLSVAVMSWLTLMVLGVGALWVRDRRL